MLNLVLCSVICKVEGVVYGCTGMEPVPSDTT